MALCLNCGNDNLETILLSQSSCSPDGLDWPDINILDAIYEPFYALYADDNMPRKTTDTKSSGKPRAPLACERCRKRKIKCSGETPDGAACSGCRSGNASSQCNFRRVGAIPAITDFSVFKNPTQLPQQCDTPSSGDTISPSPDDEQPSSAYGAHHGSQRPMQHGLLLERHLGSHDSAYPRQPPHMPSSSYAWTSDAHVLSLPSPRNLRPVSHISSQTSSLQSGDTRDSFEHPVLRPIQQQASNANPAERQTLPPLSTTIPYTPLTPNSVPSTSYSHSSGSFHHGDHGSRLQTPRGLVPAYGQLLASNNNTTHQHGYGPVSPAQLAPPFQHAGIRIAQNDHRPGPGTSFLDSKYTPMEPQQAHAYQYSNMFQHQHQHLEQRQHQHGITSPLPYPNAHFSPTTHPALPGFSTFSSPWPGFEDQYAPAVPRSSGTGLAFQSDMHSFSAMQRSPTQYGGMHPFPLPQSSGLAGGFPPVVVGHLEQPEKILGSSKVGEARRSSDKRSSKKRTSVIG